MPADKNLFQKYPNPVFIETGSLIGDGIQSALDAGFETIYSIELSSKLYDICIERFKDNDNVHIIFGDSGKELPKLLSMIKEPVTFWLDGHYSGGPTALGDLDSPLMQELDAIGNHYIKNHTLIIDDLRCWTKDTHGFDTLDIMKKILTINPAYFFIYANGHIENDILIAKI
jgi:hypothetical protein